jgi:hypothetical protein
VTHSGFLEAQQSETLTLSPAFHGCAFSKGLTGGTTVDMGGCEFELHVDGTLSIVGPSCESDPITYAMAYFTYRCTISIGPQTLTDFSYEVSGSESERALVTTEELTSLEYSLSGNLCSKYGAFDDGAYSGSSIVRATTESSEPQGLWAE